MDLALDDRVVVVTGGSSGLGLAIVAALVSEGACVATCARDADRLRDAVAAFDGDRVLAMPCDVRDRPGIESFAEAVLHRFGHVHGLVNNAGEGRPGRLDDLTDDDWRDEFEMKVLGVLNPLRAFAPGLRSADRGRVVNVTAVTAREPEARLIAVSASRAAVSNLTRSLASELAPVGVNAISVGVLDTPRTRRRYERESAGETYEVWLRHELQQRGSILDGPADPADVAMTAALLLSPRSAYVTGAVWEVSAGMARCV